MGFPGSPLDDTSVTAGSPASDSSGGHGWLLSPHRLWEPRSSPLTGWSLPASWRCVLCMHISVWSKDSTPPTKPHLVQNSGLRSSELRFLSPQLRASPELGSGASFLPPSGQCASRQTDRQAVRRLVSFASLLRGSQSRSICFPISETVVLSIVSNFPVMDGRRVNLLPVCPFQLEAEVL